MLTEFDAAAAQLRFQGAAGVFEHTALAVRVESFTVEVLDEYDPTMRVENFAMEVLDEYDPTCRVEMFCIEVLRTVQPLRRRLHIDSGRGHL